jgi:hypothetical protein
MWALCFVGVVYVDERVIGLDVKMSEKEINIEYVLHSPTMKYEASGLRSDRVYSRSQSPSTPFGILAGKSFFCFL